METTSHNGAVSPPPGRRAVRALGLDVSGHLGFAVMDVPDGRMRLRWQGTIASSSVPSRGAYPWGYMAAAASIVAIVKVLVDRYRPDVIVIEETNGSKNRYTQKMLEFYHYAILLELEGLRVEYVSTSDWRTAIGLRLSKDDRRGNRRLGEAKRKAAKKGKKPDKKAVGVKGRITAKHLAVRWVNETFGLELKQKDNDAADAVCLVAGWFNAAPLSTGIQKR